jgi:tetratricopeptide (TPR) repeat protein
MGDSQPVDSEQETPHQLGTYYQKKGEITGPSTEEGRGWYRKSVEVLLQAREISQANEKAFDDAQLTHGLPLAFRLGDDVLYLHLAESLAALGRFQEALEALRYERFLNPTSPDPYFAIASLEIQRGNLDSAAVVLDEQGLTSGRTQATIQLLQRVYSQLPDGQCAFKTAGGELRLNPECPSVARHRCGALSDLKEILKDAREPDKAAYFTAALRNLGCASPSAQQQGKDGGEISFLR